MKRTIGVLLITLLCTGTAWGNSIESSTMVFEGTLTVDGSGYAGTIAMTTGSYYCYTCPGTGAYIGDGSYPPGASQGGFDVYALEGGTAYYDDTAQGTIGADHDAYSTGGGWGAFYQPDCADYVHYELTLEAGHWYLRYNGGTLGAGNATPMSGIMDWDSMYAAETDTGAYITSPGGAGNDGDALAHITSSTGATTGAGYWDMDWTWGSEAIPLELPGFNVAVVDLGSGSYRVTLTPAAPSEVWVDDNFDDTTPGWGITHFAAIQDGIDAVSGSTVFVAPGTYTGNLTIPGGVLLTSTDGAPTTIIQGTGGVAITILGDDVTIDGFTITNHGGSNAIHATDHSGIAIVNNIITDIGSDTIQANVHAIAIVCTATDISDITIESNTISGLVARGVGGDGKGFSASGIAIGWSNGEYDITDLLIRYNTIFTVDSRTDAWPVGHGAYGIILNHTGAGHAGQTIAPAICNNTIYDLEGLWAHGIGLEGDTPNASVHGNTIYDLIDHKDPTDAVAIFVEANASADTVEILFNSFANVDVGVAVVTSAIPVNAENNWWADSSGPSTVGSGSGVMVGFDVDYEPWLTVSDIHLAAGGARLVDLQQADGGWDWPLYDGNPNNPSPLNTIGPISMGLAKAYRATGDADMLDALEDAGALLLTKTNNFSLTDGYMAAELDAIFGGTTYVDHVVDNFYTPLAGGTYNRNGAGTLYDTPTFLALISASRHNGGIGNLAAWDIGMGLVAAASTGVTGTELQYWVDAVRAEIDMLDAPGSYDVIGLAGAVYALAFVGADCDPTAGEHAAAGSLADLADILASYQIVETGGFTWDADWVIPYDYNETVQNTAYALLALDEMGGYDAAVASASAYLRGAQLCTGGWENYLHSSSGENNEVTGEAMWALWGSEPATITLVADRDCYQPGDTVTVEIWMNDVAMNIAGGQFFLAFDTDAMSFSAPSGATPEPPFDGMYLAVPAAGQIDYSVQLPPFGTPQTVTGTLQMATLTFTATEQICHASDLITWRAHNPPSRLTTRIGAQAVYPDLIALNVDDDEAPIIACPPAFAVQCADDVPTAYADLAAFISAGGTASDNCGTNLVLSLTSDTGLVGGICGGTVTRVYRVTDDCGNYAECTQVIAVDDTVAPVIACPADTTVQCDASTDPTATGTATATDNCDSDVTITYSDSVAAGSCAQASIITRTWTATDDCDNFDTCVQTITVVDTTPPEITCPDDVIVECDVSTDPADLGILLTLPFDTAPTIGASQAAGVWYTDRYAPYGFTAVVFDGGSRLMHSIDASDCSPCRGGGYTGGFYDTQGRKYDVPGTTSMRIDLYIPADWATTERRMAGFWGTAFDASAGLASYPIIEFTSSTDGTGGPRFRGWNDAAGWVDMGLPTGFTYDTWYTLQIDLVGAKWLYTVGDLTIEVDSLDAVEIGNVILQGHNNTAGVSYDIYWDNFVASRLTWATDNCDPAPTVTYADIVTAGACPQESTITRTWTATDDCGNVDTCVQTITVVDTTPPEITCPADITVSAADAGECSAVQDPGTATATDNCDPSPMIAGVRDDGLALADPYPSGTTTITWTAEDACGNEAECTQTITVASETELIVDIDLSPTMILGSVTRCITFELWECPGTSAAESVGQEITFTNGQATDVTVMIPCGYYTCITARDELHTLRSTSAMLIPTGETYYTADFTGDHELIGGNLNDDEWIDILDFGVYSWQYPTTYASGDTDCSTGYPHADINGSGIVDTPDFTFIQTNFLLGHEANCCGAPGVRLGGEDEFSGPVTEISIAELRERGLEHLAVADLNADGQLDQADVAAFLMGARPEPKPNKPTINPAAKRRADVHGDRAR